MRDFPIPASELLPHAPPMLCIDELLRVSENGAEASVFLDAGHILLHNGTLSPPGFVELAAQAAGAMKGYAETRLGKPVGDGFLAAVKKFSCTGRVQRGDTLHIAVAVTAEMGGVSLVEAVIRRGGLEGEVVARGRLKVFTPGHASG